MFRTLRKTLTAALAVLCVTSVLALAAEGTLAGTVQNVDPQQGRITVRAGEDNVVELRAPADLLIGLHKGMNHKRGGVWFPSSGPECEAAVGHRIQHFRDVPGAPTHICITERGRWFTLTALNLRLGLPTRKSCLPSLSARSPRRNLSNPDVRRCCALVSRSAVRWYSAA
jgi:hypothetical protein